MKALIRIVLGLAVTCVAAPSIAQQETAEMTSRQAALKRVTEGIKYLASDDLGGRKPGTEGIELAAQYVEKEFEKAGIKTLENGTYRQDFNVTIGRELDTEKVGMVLVGPDGTETKLELNKDFIPQVARRASDLSGDLVFVGYGINADEHNFNEYRDLDVEDKIVVMLRREPQQNNADSVFDGTEVSQYGYLRAKVGQAREAGAAAIIMVNDGVTASDEERDVLATSSEFAGSTGRLPFVQVKRSVIDELLKKAPLRRADGSEMNSLSAIEKQLDDTLEPVSQPMKGYTAKLNIASKAKEVVTSNIVGIIEGEGPHAEETIVIGGHYDHLGMGGRGSRAAGRQEVHNGADDNATGTEAVIELARRFAKRDKAPARRLVFIAFSAEEMGLLGAAHYVNNPLYPLEDTVAMVNFDMIGWLRDDNLTVYNWNSCNEFSPILDTSNEGMGLNLNKPERGFGGSDHLPFYQRKIPVMFIHTGLTSTYHTPEDDFETLDCDGALRVIEFTERVVDGIDQLDARPTFVGQQAPRRLRLGAFLDDDNEKGPEVTRVSEDSIAAKAGLKEGDVIMEIAGTKIENRRSVNRAVRSNANKTVDFKIFRDGKEMTIKITLKNED